MLPDVGKIFALLGLTFILMGLLWNFYGNLPKIPGDIYIDRAGLKIYIPFTSALIISVILTIFFNFFRK